MGPARFHCATLLLTERVSQKTLDDTVVTLLNMGFEIQDAQDAIQYGKVTVEEAIEWILAGKPGYAETRAAPTLRLTDNRNATLPNLRPDTAAPFVSPLPITTHSSPAANEGASAQSPASSPPAAMAAAPSASDMDMEQQVVSRLHLTDAKLAEKKHFEEKVRAEVEKKARMEKLQAKRERDRVLKEIAEDRKMSKIMKTRNQEENLPPTPPVVPEVAQTATCSTSVSFIASECSIQIRLPSGKQLRKKLDPSTTLGQLWIQVLDEAAAETEGYSGFMQPFPRREFNASDMNKTLQQLGFVPSGSLVLKKRDTAAATEPEQEAQPVQEPPPPEPVPEPMEEGEEHPFGRWQQVDRHQWGRGRALEGENPAEQQARDADAEMDEGHDHEMEDDAEDQRQDPHFARLGRGRRLEGPPEGEDMNGEDDDDNNDGDDDDDNQMAALNAGGAQGGINPMMQRFMGQQFGGFGGGVVRGAFMGTGQRLVPLGVPGADDHVNRRVGDLAAEAAQNRLAQPARVEVSDAPPQPVTFNQPPSLEEVAMAVVIERITGQSRPFHSLGRLPESLSEKILQQLMQRSALDSKTLRLFCSCCLRKLILDTYNYATNDLLNAVRLHPHLQVLSLHSCPLISDRGIEVIADLKKLKVLNLGVCQQITNKCLKVIVGFRNLHTLSLEETGVTDSGLGEYLATKPCLRNLNLNRTAITDAIFPLFRNLEQLETLCLEETKISSLEGVTELKKLTGLNLASTAITTDTLVHLQHHPTLLHLSLANTENVVGDQAFLFLKGLKLRTLCLPDRHSVSSAGLEHIAAFPLNTLDLTNYIHVGDDGMEHVGKITTLETLMLSNTKVTDAGLGPLSSLTHLKILYLDRTSVSDVGIGIVRAFRELSELSLSATNVSNRFLKEGVLHSCLGLTKLNLSRTQVGDRGVERLRLPHLCLLNLDCTGVHAAVVDTLKANCPSLRFVTTANLTPVLEEDEEED
ncbi:hypothetical protein ACOMHN_024302 [Nucella lapillus]